MCPQISSSPVRKWRGRRRRYGRNWQSLRCMGCRTQLWPPQVLQLLTLRTPLYIYMAARADSRQGLRRTVGGCNPYGGMPFHIPAAATARHFLPLCAGRICKQRQRPWRWLTTAYFGTTRPVKRLRPPRLRHDTIPADVLLLESGSRFPDSSAQYECADISTSVPRQGRDLTKATMHIRRPLTLLSGRLFA